jgi:hypothetical protein
MVQTIFERRSSTAAGALSLCDVRVKESRLEAAQLGGFLAENRSEEKATTRSPRLRLPSHVRRVLRWQKSEHP